MTQVVVLLLSLLDPNAAQAARHMGEQKRNMIASIQQHGVLQPPGVVKVGERYRVIWGNGRVVCAKEAGLKEIPCVVLDKPMSEQEYLVLMGTENIVANRWKPWELTDYLKSLADTGMSQKEMSKKLGDMDQGLISAHLSIANRLIQAGLDAYRAGRLPMTTAAAISREDPQRQHELLAEATTRGATRAKVMRKKNGNGDQVKASSITIVTPSGVKVTFKGIDLTLGRIADEGRDAVKIIEKGEKEGLTAKTISKASAERAKVAGGSVKE